MQDNEVLLYAAFDTESQEGEKLEATDFNATELKRGDLSIARQQFTSLDDFRKKIVKPKVSSGSVFRGASSVHASELRNIIETVQGRHPVLRLRGVCVLDKAEVGDHAGHAALQTCLEQESLTANQKKNIRAALTADLSDLFSEIMPIEIAYAS